MLTEDIYKALNELSSEKGVLQTYLFDKGGNLLGEDNSQNFSTCSKEHSHKQICALISLAAANHINAEELIFDTDDMRTYIRFVEKAILVVYCSSDTNFTLLKLSLNSLCTKINDCFGEVIPKATIPPFASQLTKPQNRSGSRSSSFDKASLPEIIEAEPDFVIYLKQLLNKHGSPEATIEVKNYIVRNKLNQSSMDSFAAYNLISYLSSYVNEERSESFTIEAQEVMNHYF